MSCVRSPELLAVSWATDWHTAGVFSSSSTHNVARPCLTAVSESTRPRREALSQPRSNLGISSLVFWISSSWPTGSIPTASTCLLAERASSAASTSACSVSLPPPSSRKTSLRRRLRLVSIFLLFFHAAETKIGLLIHGYHYAP